MLVAVAIVDPAINLQIKIPLIVPGLSIVVSPGPPPVRFRHAWENYG